MSAKNDHLSESLEDYLEAILELEETHKVARAKDIAEKLGVQRGSVTGSLKALKEKGLIEQEHYGYVSLTKQGVRMAREIARRHTVLKDFLLSVLQLAPQEAEDVACKMEHALVNKSSVDRLVQFVEFVQSCPRAGPDWLEAFVNNCGRLGQNHSSDKCKTCLTERLKEFKSN